MNIKVGDKVRKKNDKKFRHTDEYMLEVTSIAENDPIFKIKLSNHLSYHPDDLELATEPLANVNDPTKPSHYTYGEIETIDYIRDKLTPEQFEGYCIGNVHKYISRYKLKNGQEDLEKAKVYLGWAIEAMEG